MGEDAMVRSGTPDGDGDQQSLGDLVSLALKDLSQLLHYEISLAKSELRMDVRRAGRSPRRIEPPAAFGNPCTS